MIHGKQAEGTPHSEGATKEIEQKRAFEKKVVAEMVGLYCRKHHKTKEGLCSACRALLEYSNRRSDKCPFMETKTFCANCKVHCYKKDKREAIRQVMRFSGPRMMFYHPAMAVRHLTETLKEKKRLEKEQEQ